MMKQLLLKKYIMLAQEFEKQGMECEFHKYTSAKHFIDDYKKNPYDIVFLDIIMPEYSGFQVASEIRNHECQTYIIFITTNDESVYDSFEFQPFYFICKDDDTIFSNRIKHVVKSLVRHLKQNRFLLFNLAFSEKKKVKISNIQAIKSDRNYLEIYCTNMPNLRIRGKLSELESQLLDYDFIRVHNRWIINMRHIQLPDYPNEEIIMTNNLIVPLSRSHKGDMQIKYSEYIRCVQ